MGISEVFYSNLIANTRDPQRIASLKRIHAACNALEKGAAQAYTIADVGRYCELHWGGPKAQSIRNSSDVLAKYIRLRAAEHLRRAAGDGERGRTEGGLDLSDPEKAQHQFLMALAEIERLKQEVSRLRLRAEGYSPTIAEELVALASARR